MKPAALELAQRFSDDGLTPVQLEYLLSTKGIGREEFLEALNFFEWQKTKRLIFVCVRALVVWGLFWYFFVMAASR